MSIGWSIFLILFSIVIGGAVVWLIQQRKPTSLIPASFSPMHVANEPAPRVEVLVLGPVENPLMEVYPAPDNSSLVQIDAPSRDAECPKQLAKRTLAKLHNDRLAWLASAHEQLDAAVAAAYGIDTRPGQQQTLKRQC